VFEKIEKYIWKMIFSVYLFVVYAIFPLTVLGLIEIWGHYFNEVIINTITMIIYLYVATLIVLVYFISATAANFKVDLGMGFFDSCTATIGEVKIKISYLPLIGKLIKIKDDEET